MFHRDVELQLVRPRDITSNMRAYLHISKGSIIDLESSETGDIHCPLAVRAKANDRIFGEKWRVQQVLVVGGVVPEAGDVVSIYLAVYSEYVRDWSGVTADLLHRLGVNPDKPPMPGQKLCTQ